MIKRLLIANRGEIAVRIIRACRELGVETVLVYSEADADSLPVRLADRSVKVGPAPSAKSYLALNNLLMAALRTDCDAIHPGVGFLSENAAFARAVRKEGLLFIGPEAETIELLGDKVRARETARRFGLPLTPGSEGAIADDESALRTAESLGYPIILKAAAGGGGKGMRVVREPKELSDNLALASREASAHFSSGVIYMEKYLENPRHVELQILADGNGTVAVLGERDCSVQKNHQKLIEESPSPGVTPAMRERMSKGAVRLFRELAYRGAGTIEFLVSGDQFFFMEVNARVQVEHPVSEFVSGVDIIRQQLFSCAEGRLEFDADKVELRGWSIECRINAKSAGRITRLELPGGPGVRWDSFLFNGCAVPPYYDSMVGKLIVHAPDRRQALDRMDRALRELTIEGINVNTANQRFIVNHPRFRSGDFGTALYAELEKELDNGR